MLVQQIQEIVVFATALAVGVLLLRLDDRFLPEGVLRDWSQRLGSKRRLVGWIIVVLSAGLLIATVADVSRG